MICRLACCSPRLPLADRPLPPSPTLQDELLAIITDPTLDALQALRAPALSDLTKAEQHDLLALRGLLACGLLVFCLQLRHKVRALALGSCLSPGKRVCAAGVLPSRGTA